MTLLETLVTLVILITLIGVALGRYPRLKMNRATIAVVGATILLLLGVLPMDVAFMVIDWHTILLLFAMMILNVNLRLAGFFSVVIDFVQRRAGSPRMLLFWLVTVSGTLSALFLNDTVAVMLTPLVIELIRGWNRNPLPYLIALALAVNIGSVATITGNPQNMLIGIASELSYVEFSRTLLPVAVGGLAIVWWVVVLLFPEEFKRERLLTVLQPVTPRVYRPLLYKSLIATALLLLALLAGVPVSLAALSAAALLLVTRRVRPERVFRELDWNLLVFFSGLFVVTGAIEKSIAGSLLSEWIPPLAESGILSFSLGAAALSNLVSNVPAVMLFRPYIPMVDNPHAAWLTLAMATTLAGNLTLLGSVANLIVAESAARMKVELGFVSYLKAGVPVTILSLLWGCTWLSWFLT